MTIGELKERIERLDDGLEIEVLTPYDDSIDSCFLLDTIEVRMDPDAAAEYAAFVCVDA